MKRSIQLTATLAWLGMFVVSCPAEVPPVVDATTLHHKVMCGYQGWFRCPGDGTGEGWQHWSRDRQRLTAESLTVEMWPELAEFSAEEKFAVPGFTLPDGSPAHLFSSAHPRTVERHFEWMRDYGIDGAFVQRFLVNLDRPSFDKVLANVRASAARTGRAYAIGYDLTGLPADKTHERLTADWKRLVDVEKVTKDACYLHHNGRPVLFVWGFFSDRFDAKLAHRLIDFLKMDDRYQVTLIGGCPWHWRQEQNADWARAYRRFDVISPWNVGHWQQVDGERQAATYYWRDDLAEAQRRGRDYLPVIYPGFGWTNLKGRAAADATIPRLGGRFFWRQFVACADHDISMAYVAMFDEVDEATAIFKVCDHPPRQGRLATLEGLPSDWYLRLTGEGAKLIRGERETIDRLPFELPR